MKHLLLLLMVLAGSSMAAQTADEIINKHIEATGGLDKWSKVTSITYTGAYVMGPGMLPPVTTILVGKPFLGYYNDFSWQGMTNKIAMKADSGWSYDPFSGKRETDPLSPNDIRGLKLESDPQGLLVNYKQKGCTVDYLGMDDMEGSDVYKLRLINSDGDMVYYYIDAETYYILKTSVRIKLKDKETKSFSVFSDFRKTDYGVTVPFSVQNVNAKGEEQGGPVNYTSVVVNGNINYALFDKP